MRANSELAQRTSNAQVLQNALNYLNDCRTRFEKLKDLVRKGELYEAVILSRKVNKVLEDAPTALAQANVMVDMKVHFL